MLYIHPRQHFDCCISKIDIIQNRVYYDYDLLIQGFMHLGMTYSEAASHICYNIISAEYNANFPKISFGNDDGE